MKIVSIPVDITVPSRHRKPTEAKVASMAISMQKGQLQPIMVRKHRETFILVFGRHRLDAAKANGDAKIAAIVTDMNELYQ